jgi:hypothetical protein
MICRKCGKSGKISPKEGICQECYKGEKALIKHNDFWIDASESAGLELWERQPQETDQEWSVWCAWKAYYPGKQRTKTEIAAELGMSVATLSKTAKKWCYDIRMRSWAAHVDQLIRNTRYNDLMEANKKHIEMATRLSEKLAVAIDNLDPYEIKPSQLNQLLRTAAELEHKARVDVVATGEKISENAGVVQATKKEAAPIKRDQMNEVLGILVESGAIGIKETRTTELIREEVIEID